MKQLAHIAVAFTTLILILFSSSGVGMMTCACSGETSLVQPFDEGCCGSDRSCMTVEVVQMADSEVAATLEVPAAELLGELNQLSELHSGLVARPVACVSRELPCDLPPPLGRLSMVMRV